MQKSYAIFLWLVIFLCAGNIAFGQAVFRATVSADVIGKSETVELSLLIENAKKPESITPPELKNFLILNGPVQQNGDVEINGIVRTFIGYIYILKPKSSGDFIIPSAIAKADGITLKSNSIKIKVLDVAIANPPAIIPSPLLSNDIFGEQEKPVAFKDDILKKSEDVPAKIAKNLFIKVEVDKKSCYVGEPVLVTYKLYSRLGENSDIVTSPSFNGFSVIDQPKWDEYNRKETLNGRDYYVYLVRKSQLYPLQAGEQYLEKAVVESKIHFKRWESIKHAYDDGGIEFTPGSNNAERYFDTTVLIESEPVLINVKPLPEKKPASFNGAVGNFRIDAFIEKDSLTTDDAGKLKFLLSGQGNMTLVPAPEIAWPDGIEGYEPTVKDGINKVQVPVSGSKIFDFAFTAAKEGSYTIPPVEFSYFDIDSGKYKTISTQPLTIHVTKGTGKRPAIAIEATETNESIADIIFANRWMIIVPIALLIIIGLLIWVSIDKKRQRQKLIDAALQRLHEEKAVVEDSLPLNPLQQSELALIQNDSRKFYETLDKELYSFLAQQLQLPVQTISKRGIADGLDKSGIALSESLAIQKLLDDVALQLYTPFSDETKMQEYYVEAVRLVNAFNKTTPV